MRSPICTLLLVMAFNSLMSQNVVEKNFKAHFEKYGVDGCFVLYNQAKDEYIRYDSALCDMGYIPASTFKIPHSLIALQEGVIADTNELIKWNGHKWPHKVWNRDQTLITSIKYSCIWVYFYFAEQIGIDKYYDYVRAFDYGNKNLAGPPTRFWLNGEFRISANQQIDFLSKFYNYQLPVDSANVDIIKEIIVLAKNDRYTLSGKTGGGVVKNNKHVMWLVGYVESDGNPYFYAMNFISDDFEKHGKARHEITKLILKELSLIN